MSKSVYLVVEGLTEQLFCERVLAPYLATRDIFLYASQIRKKGAGGGDVRFERAKSSIAGYLKQQSNTLVGTFVDYYGIKEWPGLNEVEGKNLAPGEIARCLNAATISEVTTLLPEIDVQARFVPFVSVHEFESLLFSDPHTLASGIGMAEDVICEVVTTCGGPEYINNSPQTAPSKRILTWTKNRYGKTTQGISIAMRIGIDAMREQCPIFDAWLSSIESRCSTSRSPTLTP